LNFKHSLSERHPDLSRQELFIRTAVDAKGGIGSAALKGYIAGAIFFDALSGPLPSAMQI
jgi:hypothetical protein